VSPPAPSPLLGLAPGGVCLAGPVTRAAGELLPHLFTLTLLVNWYISRLVIDQYLIHQSTNLLTDQSTNKAVCFCGTFRGSPRLGVTQHRALRSSDFPRRLFRGSRRDRLAHLSTNFNITQREPIVKLLDFTHKSSEGIEELQEALEEAFLR